MLTTQALKIFIKEQPFSYVFEICDFIAEEYDIDISEESIRRMLKEESISRKKVHTL